MNTVTRILAEIERLSQGGRETGDLRVKDIKYFKKSSKEEIQDLLQLCINSRAYGSTEYTDTCIRLCREYLGLDIATNQVIRDNLIKVVQKLDSELNSLRVRLNISTEGDILSNTAGLSVESLMDMTNKLSSEIVSLRKQLRHGQSATTTSSVGEMLESLNNPEEDFHKEKGNYLNQVTNPKFSNAVNNLADKIEVFELGNAVTEEELKSVARMAYSMTTQEIADRVEVPVERINKLMERYKSTDTVVDKGWLEGTPGRVSDFCPTSTSSIEDIIEPLNNPDIDFHNTDKGVKSGVNTLPEMSTEQMANRVGISVDEMMVIRDKYIKRNSLTMPEKIEVEEEFENMFKPTRKPLSSRPVIVPEQEDYKCPTCGSTNITKTLDRVSRVPVLTCNDCVRRPQSSPNYKEDMNGDILYSNNLEVGYKLTDGKEDEDSIKYFTDSIEFAGKDNICLLPNLTTRMLKVAKVTGETRLLVDNIKDNEYKQVLAVISKNRQIWKSLGLIEFNNLLADKLLLSLPHLPGAKEIIFEDNMFVDSFLDSAWDRGYTDNDLGNGIAILRTELGISESEAKDRLTASKFEGKSIASRIVKYIDDYNCELPIFGNKGLNAFSNLNDDKIVAAYRKTDAELTRQLYIRTAIRERLEAFAGEIYFDIFEAQSSWEQICTVNEELLITMIISCMSERGKTYDVIKQLVSRFHDREIYSLVDSVLDTLSLIDNNINQLNRIKPVRALEELTVTADITPELKEHYEAAKFEKATTPKTMSMREEQLKDTSLEEFLNKIYIKVMGKIDSNSDILKEVLKSDLTQSYKLPVFHSRKEILSEDKGSVKERLNSFIDLTSSRKIGTLPISINKVKDKIKIATRKKDILRLPITSILVMVEREIILIRDSKSIKITGLVQDALQLLEESNDGLIAVLGNRLYDRTRVHLYNEGYKPRAINLGEYLDELGIFGELNLLTGSIGDISITDIVSLYEGQEKLYIEF